MVVGNMIITSSRTRQYRRGLAVKVKDFIHAYTDKARASEASYLWRIPVPDAVEYIARKIKVTYKYI